MSQFVQLTAIIQDSQLGRRLDKALAELFPDYSRTHIKEWIMAGNVKINHHIVTQPKGKVFGGEFIEITAQIEEAVAVHPQNIPLDIVYEDDDILVINKPRDRVVHPGAGNPDGTLLNALLYYHPKSCDVPRAGIVHRLDKDTTGLLVVAKTIIAQTHLVKALQNRDIIREYEAIVIGRITAGGKVDEPISRHATKRTLMAVHPMGKPAVTHYRIMEHYRAHTRLRLRLETGRTHQIRVHMAYINHPLVGDQTYSGRFRLPKGASEEFIDRLRQFNRQALHAVKLGLNHPINGEWMEWQVPLPEDLQQLIHILQKDAKQAEDKSF